MNLIAKILFLISLGACSTAPIKEKEVLSKVPNGKIEEMDGREIKVQTLAGTTVDLEFDRRGRLKEAEGKALNYGDTFRPGNGLMSLEEIALDAQASGLNVGGKWDLEKHLLYGWVYVLEGNFLGKPTAHLIDAESGRIIHANY